MIFLFGWGHGTVRDDGETLPVMCDNCNNERFWHLTLHRRWFTLFFVPVFPYESAHYLQCPVCQRAAELDGEQLEQAQALNAARKAFEDSTMSEEEYLETIRQSPLFA